MDSSTRYPTIIKHKKNFILVLNQGHKHKGHTDLFIFKEKKDNFLLKNTKKILENKCCISHNFTIVKHKDKNKNIYYGIGGKNSNQPPWNYNNKKYFPGIYLLKSNDLLNWSFVQKKPIVDLYYPKNAFYTKTEHPEPKGPLWDSNICCFYSELLKKYILYVRANLRPSIRYVQQITSNDLINWSDYKKINVDTFDEYSNNFYMFKVVELVDKKIFFALTPFTDKPDKPNELYIKKLISFDSINWIDYGALVDGELMDWNTSRMNMHVADISYENNMLKIFLQFGYCCKNDKHFIKMYKFKINTIKELKEIRIKHKNKIGKILISD